MRKLFTLVFVCIAFIGFTQNPAFKPGTITMIGSGLNQTMQQIQYPITPSWCPSCYVLTLKKLRWYYLTNSGYVSGFKTAPHFGNGTIDIQLPSHCQGKLVVFFEEIKWYAPFGTQTAFTPKVAKIIN